MDERIPTVDIPDNFDVYQVYAGRVPERPEFPDRIDWPIEDLEKELQSHADGLGEGKRVRTQWTASDITFYLSVNDDTGINCNSYGKEGTLRAQENGVFQWVLDKHSDSLWYLMDKYVNPGLRGNGIGSSLLQFSERVVQQFADTKGQEQSMDIPVRQPSVISFYLKRGYAPKTPEDARKIHLMLSGDESLVCAQEFGTDSSFKDPMCFEKTTKPNEYFEFNAFTAILEKRFSPSEDPKQGRIGGMIDVTKGEMPFGA